jgi:hypothetical protein
MANRAGEIGQLREEELPVVRVIVPPDLNGRVFEDDLDPGDLIFDGKLTPMLVWHECYPVGHGCRSGWVLSYDTDGKGNPDDYIVGLGLPDVDAPMAQAREYLRSIGYPRLAGRRHDYRSRPTPRPGPTTKATTTRYAGRCKSLTGGWCILSTTKRTARELAPPQPRYWPQARPSECRASCSCAFRDQYW